LVKWPSAVLARITCVIAPAAGILSTYAKPWFKKAFEAVGAFVVS